jgi:hypothetical protein
MNTGEHGFWSALRTVLPVPSVTIVWANKPGKPFYRLVPQCLSVSIRGSNVSFRLRDRETFDTKFFVAQHKKTT